MRVAANLEPFATVESAYAVTVAIPDGDASQGARLSAEVLGVRFNALVAASELELHLKKQRLLAGFVWVGPDSVLRWTRAAGGRVAYEVVLPVRVSPRAGQPTGEQACQDLSVDGGDEDALPRTVFGRRRSVLQTRWRGEARVPLAHAPGQSPLAFLDTRATCTSDEPEVECEPPEPDELFVLEKRADWLRVVYVLDTITVEGWVPEAAVQKRFERVETAGLLPGTPWGPVELFGANDPTLALANEPKALCAWNAPLAAETSGVFRSVGSITSGIPLLPGIQRQGWREVALAHHPALSFAADARAWVPERFLYPCRL